MSVADEKKGREGLRRERAKRAENALVLACEKKGVGVLGIIKAPPGRNEGEKKAARKVTEEPEGQREKKIGDRRRVVIKAPTQNSGGTRKGEKRPAASRRSRGIVR